MTKSIYISKLGDRDVRIHFATMTEEDYVVILITDLKTNEHICTPSVYLPKANRDKDEVFLDPHALRCHGVVDMLVSDGLIESGQEKIARNNGEYADVYRLTDKAKDVISGYKSDNS